MSQSPQLGYNHNIPHRGRLYHVQTEDSGLKKAHIFTHCFYDGTIIASNKVDYDPEAQVDDLDAHIIGLMQESHKAMIRRLRKSEFDEKIERYIGPHPEDDKPAPEPAPPPPSQLADARPERRAPPQPRDVERVGPPLTPGGPSPALDPSVSHPIHASASAEASGPRPTPPADPSKPPPRRGPGRTKRRTIGGIGGSGVRADAQAAVVRRDVIIGKFASAHQAELDEEILALLREG